MKKYYRRTFLNKGKGVASLEIDFEDVYGSVKISDCNRAVSLSFDFSNKKEKDNSLFKINTLVTELTVLKQKIESSND